MQGWQTYGAWKDYSWQTLFTVVPIFFKFLLPNQRLCTVKNIHISDYAENVYELPLLPNNTVCVEHFYTNLEWCKVLTRCLSQRRRPGSEWVNK